MNTDWGEKKLSHHAGGSKTQNPRTQQQKLAGNMNPLLSLITVFSCNYLHQSCVLVSFRNGIEKFSVTQRFLTQPSLHIYRNEFIRATSQTI